MTESLPNPQRGETEVELAGAKIRLVPSFAAMARIERLTETRIVSLARRFQAGDIGATDVRAVIQGAAADSLPKDLDAAIYAAGVLPLGAVLAGLLAEMVTGGRVGNGETPAAETPPAAATSIPGNG